MKGPLPSSNNERNSCLKSFFSLSLSSVGRISVSLIDRAWASLAVRWRYGWGVHDWTRLERVRRKKKKEMSNHECDYNPHSGVYTLACRK